MKKYLLLLAVLISVNCLFAQKRNVVGVVTDTDGKPLKGIQLKVLDTKIQVKTNKNGEFLLKSVRPDDSVVVYLQRDKGAKFLLGDVEKLQLKLKKEAIQIDNGRGVSIESLFEKQLLKEYGSGNVISARMIERNGYLSINEAIKACIPGVNFQITGNGEEKVSIRGEKSLNLSNEPLVILDGVETDIANANVNCSIYDVELIEVIKDGLGYGVKGANGVIVIKTKK